MTTRSRHIQMADPIILSSAGFKNINLENSYIYSNINDDFTFFAGPISFKLKRLWADFISPRVSRFHFTDPTLRSIRLDELLLNNPYNQQFLKTLVPDHFVGMNEPNSNENCSESEKVIKSNYYSYLFSDDIIQTIEALATGCAIEIDSTSASKLRIVSFLFENDELLQILNKTFPFDFNNSSKSLKVHLDECLDYLLSSYFLIRDNTIIEFIAKHFYEVEKSKLLLLPKTILLSIISHPRLVIKNEDKLYEFIEDIFSEQSDNNEYTDDGQLLTKTHFYEYVNFTTLSDDTFDSFINSFDPNNISINLWRKLTNCFYSPGKGNNSGARKRAPKLSKQILIDYDGQPQNRFKGIISQLTSECNGNIHDKEIAIIASSTCSQNGQLPKVIANLTSYSYFQSQNNRNSWVCFDFQNSLINPNAYSIRSRYDFGPGGNHMMNWKVEGSNDSIKWTLLDEKTNEQSLNNANASNTFTITNSSQNKYFRYIKISETGYESSGMYYMTMSAVEFFGEFLLQS